MKHCPSGVRAFAVASAALTIAVVTLPTLLVSSPAGADTASAAQTPPVPAATAAPAALSITASSTTASYSAVGNTISYTYSVTNSGGVPLTNVSVADDQTAPSGPTTAPVCQSVSGAGACSGSTAAIAPGGAATFTATYAVNQGDLDNGTVVGSATATGTLASGGTIGATSNQSIVRAVQSPALTVTNSSTVVGSSTDTYTGVGQTIDLTSVLTNTGNVTLNSVTLTDENPGVVGRSCAGTVLSPGANETCTATSTTSNADEQAGSFADTTTGTGTAPSGVKVTATASFTVNGGKNPAVSGANRAPANSGFTPAPANNLVPANNPAPVNTNTVNTGTVNTSTVNTNIVNTNIAKAEAINGDQKQGQGQSQGQGQGQKPAISLKKSATVVGSSDGRYSAPGQTIDYSYLIKNTGNVSLSPVTLTDPMLGLQGLNCPDETLFPGVSETCTATYTTTLADVQAGAITNTATATGTPTCGGPKVWATSSARVFDEHNAAISLKKSATVVGSSDGRYSAPGQTIDYSYLITNTGNVALNPVTLLDPKPGLEDLSCPDTALFPGISETCTATYTTTQADVDAGSISNTATATGKAPCGQMVWATSSAKVYADHHPAISLTKSATVVGSSDGRYSAPGQTIDYSYLVTNTGNVTLDPVTLADPLPALRGLSCPDTSLAPGGSETCTATYTTTQADVDAGSITNTATATGTPPCGPKVTATSSVTVYAEQSPSISVVKTANVGAVATVGQTVLYTFTVTNTGNVTLTNVDVTDAQAAPSLDSSLGPITCTTGTNGAITLAPGATDTCSATYTATQADLNNGSVTDTATATGRPPSGPPVTGTSTLTLKVVLISVTKAVNPTSIVAGSTSPIVYTITVRNIGTATTSSPITVTDSAPTGTTLVTGSPACAAGGPPNCTVSTSGSTITWSIAAGVAPGASYTLTYSVTLNSSESAGAIITNTAVFSGPSCGTATCSSNTVTTIVTAAPVTVAATVTPPVTPTVTPAVTPASTAPTSPSSTPSVAFTGAFLSLQVFVGLGALALGSVLLVVPRRRRRGARGAVE
jgi:uncharacterized repeat protein (TIGR01451 family)